MSNDHRRMIERLTPAQRQILIKSLAKIVIRQEERQAQLKTLRRIE